MDLQQLTYLENVMRGKLNIHDNRVKQLHEKAIERESYINYFTHLLRQIIKENVNKNGRDARKNFTTSL